MRGGRGEREYATLIFLTSHCSRVAVPRRVRMAFEISCDNNFLKYKILGS